MLCPLRFVNKCVLKLAIDVILFVLLFRDFNMAKLHPSLVWHVPPFTIFAERHLTFKFSIVLVSNKT